MSDSFFDMPAGYSDADLEMAELERLGNLHAKRVRRFGEDGYRRLQAGETLERSCRRKEDGFTYTASVRMDDGDFVWTMDGGETWHNSAREALNRWQADFAYRR